MKKTLIIGAALFLSACGFKPVHSATLKNDAPAFSSLKVELVDPDRVNQKEAGYYLQQHLYDRIGQNAGPHVLKISPRARRRPYGLTANDVASRFDLVLNVRYELIDSATGEKLYAGSVGSTSTFGSSRDPYARISAEKNATEQVARDAADRLLLRMSAYYNDPEKYKKHYKERLAEQLKNRDKHDHDRGDDDAQDDSIDDIEIIDRP